MSSWQSVEISSELVGLCPEAVCLRPEPVEGRIPKGATFNRKARRKSRKMITRASPFLPHRSRPRAGMQTVNPTELGPRPPIDRDSLTIGSGKHREIKKRYVLESDGG